jgi:hypothetical protein
MIPEIDSHDSLMVKIDSLDSLLVEIDSRVGVRIFEKFNQV